MTAVALNAAASGTSVAGHTVVEPLRRWAEHAPDRAAVVFTDRAVTYGELVGWADAVAAEIQGRGVGPGDRVAVVGPNGVTWCAAALGVLAAGATLAPLNHRWVAREIADALDTCSPTLVVADPSCLGAAAPALAGRPDRACVTFGEVDALRGREGRRVEAPVDGDDPAIIVFTSGSTARPKGVTFTHRNLLTSIFEWSLLEPGFRGPQRLLLALPLAGSAGILRGLLYPLVAGGTVYLEPRVEPERMLDLVEHHRITVLNSVPYVFERLAESPRFATADLSSLVLTTVGGAPVTPRLLATYRRRGIVLRQIWGMTEGGGTCTINSADLAGERPELCGRGGIWTRFRVIRPDGTPCDPDEPGEILLGGPGVTVGYWGDATATADAFVDGWLRTGDVGRVDADGNLAFVGRQKDMIISGGINIAALEVETVLSGLDGVREVAVFGVPDPRFGEAVAAVVHADPAVDADAVVGHCTGRLADFKVPRRLALTDKPLPRLASGKLSKVAIRDRFGPQLATGHPPVPRSTEI